MASKKYQPCLEDQTNAIKESGMQFSYFNRDVFSGCFILPEFVRKLIQ
jgi:spermidine synthase